ncbi:general stress protein [Flavobacterium cheongpyeongense]|jgi:general stress protein 26|uniref:General stress protein n=1 Tax=Flavobacterium cheongpyeongense TaxID=2212651 RepID=A0A2V4BNN8_9FLAO|nr:pyridoxamine 5'-phosphate oxidase family protein [Flavobacterium cheongpyeongense]PXY40471.1 general stress protein [Flavobacterium cheongpyeongense]
MHKDLNNKEALAKLISLVKDINVAVFVTELTKMPLQSRPMNVQDIDDQGNLWFISSARSNKNFEILKDDHVQLFFANNSSSQYISIYGTATIYKDQQIIDELWTPVARAWFEEGQKDPAVTVIKVTPSDAYYWDTKDGKIISLIKMAGSAIFGTTSDVGAKGKLKL